MRQEFPMVRRLIALVVVGLAVLAASVVAQDRVASPAERRVRDAILSKFRVLPVQRGIVLVPTGRYEGVDNVELREGTIAINGRPATGAEVRQKLGSDGDAVLELSYIDFATQERLLLKAGTDDTPKPEPRGRETGAGEATPPPSAERAQDEPRTPEPDKAPARQFKREVQSRLRLGGHVTIDDDEEVTGPVVAVGGSITVNGRVRDDVVAVGGDVTLGSRAEVMGDVTVIGGAFHRTDGATVRGHVNEVTPQWPTVHLRPWTDWGFRVAPWFDNGPWRAIRLLGTILRILLFGLMATLVLLLAPRAVTRVAESVRTQPWTAALTGFFAQLLFIPLLVLVTVLLAVSIIGIPLLVLVPFVVLAFFVALLLGFTGAASAVAGAGRSRFGWTASGAFAHLIVGLALIWGLTVIGRMLSIGGGPLPLVGGIFLVAGFLFEYAVWTVGLGGALLTRFGRRGPEAAPMYAEPYVPPVPAVPTPFEDTPLDQTQHVPTDPTL
jgi:hypothetical protein